MIDRYGKELTTTYRIEESDGSLKFEATLSTEANIDDIIGVLYSGLIAHGWQESTILDAMYVFSTEKMGASVCYDENYDRHDYKEAFDDGVEEERYDMNKYAREHPVENEDKKNLLDVDEYINMQREKERERENNRY